MSTPTTTAEEIDPNTPTGPPPGHDTDPQSPVNHDGVDPQSPVNHDSVPTRN